MKDGRRFGKPPTPYSPPETPGGKVNITDPDSRNVKPPRGYMQGYNTQGVCNEHQIVVAAELNTDSPDFGHLEPMVRAAERELTAAGVSEQPQVVVADAGYWHHDQMDQLAGDGIQVLIPPDAGKRKGARPGWDGGRYAFMRRVLETELGKQLYGKRQETIEPVFANTKFNRRLDRFLRRGISACRSEWRLITATNNLLKLHSYQTATAGLGPPRPTEPHAASRLPPSRPPRLCATATGGERKRDRRPGFVDEQRYQPALPVVDRRHRAAPVAGGRTAQRFYRLPAARRHCREMMAPRGSRPAAGP
jgi:Transposase DDE domain